MFHRRHINFFFILLLISSFTGCKHSSGTKDEKTLREVKEITTLASFTFQKTYFEGWRGVKFDPVVVKNKIYWSNLEFTIENKESLSIKEHNLGQMIGVVEGFIYVGEHDSNFINVYEGEASSSPELVNGLDLANSDVICDIIFLDEIIVLAASRSCYDQEEDETWGELIVIDVSEPSAPVIIQKIDTGPIVDMEVLGNHIYTVGISFSTFYFDSDTKHLTLTNKVEYPYSGNNEDMYDDLDIINNRYANSISMIGADKLIFRIDPIPVTERSKLELFDVSKPSSPKRIKTFEPKVKNGWQIQDVFEGIIFLSDSGDNLQALTLEELSSPLSPEGPVPIASVFEDNECEFFSQIVEIDESKLVYCFDFEEVFVLDVSSAF